jgi:putative radical SAM enzyme (TIGR03279 family)
LCFLGFCLFLSRIELMPKLYGWVREVVPESPADRAGIQPGDLIRTINGHLIRDLVDYRFYAADEALTIGFERQQEQHEVPIAKSYDENLGVLFGEEPAPYIRQCANKCVFCFIKGLPERFAPQPGLPHGMRSSLYIKDDDYRYSFLFGNFITLTNLKEHDWQRLDEQKLTPLYVSVHATEPELRRKMVDGPRAGDILGHIQRLGSMHITCHTQLVLCPTINDGEHLERSIRDLAQLRPIVESISVVPVGLTKYNNMIKTGDLPPLRHYTRQEAEAVIEQVEDYQRRFEAEDEEAYPFVYLSDEWYYLTGREFPPAQHYGSYAQIENGVGMTRYLIDQWERGKRRLPRAMQSPHRVTLVTSTMARPVIEQLAQDMRNTAGLDVRVLPVVNQFFGPEVTVAGLLCGQDVLDALQAQDETAGLGDLVLLPRVMLDNEGARFLDDLSVEEFREKLPRSVRAEFVRNAQETVAAISSLASPAKVTNDSSRRVLRVQAR